MRLKAPKASFKPDPKVDATTVKRVTQKAENESMLNPEKASEKADNEAAGSKAELSSKLDNASTTLGIVGTLAPDPRVKVACMAGSTACGLGAYLSEKIGSAKKGDTKESAKELASNTDTDNTVDMKRDDQQEAIQLEQSEVDLDSADQTRRGNLIAQGADPAALQQMGSGQVAELHSIVESAPAAQPWVATENDNGNSSSNRVMGNLSTASDVSDIAQSVSGNASAMDPEQLRQLQDAQYAIAQAGPELA